MVDSAFTDNTIGSANYLGTLGFEGTGVTGNFFQFGNVGVTSDPALGWAPASFSTSDQVDFYSFDPFELSSVKVTLRSSTVGDYVNYSAIIPISGISDVDGTTVGVWSGGTHETVIDVFGDMPIVSNFKKFYATNVINYTQNGSPFPVDFPILPFGIFDDTGFEVNKFPDVSSTWALTGAPVVFAVFGLHLEGSIVFKQNGPFLDPVLEDDAVYQDVDYRFTIDPLTGTAGGGSGGSGGSGGNGGSGGSNGGGSGGAGTVAGLQFLDSLAVAETFFGTASRDKFETIGDSSEFSLFLESDGSIRVVDSLFPDADDILVDIERIEFNDGTLALDIDGNAGQVYRLYEAAFNRRPDVDGLVFWTDAVDRGSVTLINAANSFVFSDEFTATYGSSSSVSNGAFVDLLYLNILDRAGEDDGVNFWTGELSNGNYSRAQVLFGFSESDENYFGVLSDIENGIWLPGYSSIA